MKYRYRNPDVDGPRDDVARIRAAFQELGHEIGYCDAEEVWDKVSEDYCACWLTVPAEAEAVFGMMEDFIEPEAEETE